MKFLPILLLVVVHAFAGCETTGDPRQGGIFWSERKAQDRLQAKKEELREIEDDTARVQRRSGSTKRQIDDEG